MPRRAFLTFRAAFPDEPQRRENGRLLVPAGRWALNAIASALRSGGLCVSEPRRYRTYGWLCEVRFLKHVEWLLLQGGDALLLVVEEGIVWWARLFGAGTSTDHERVLAMIDGFVVEDPRFSAVQWLMKQENMAARECRDNKPLEPSPRHLNEKNRSIRGKRFMCVIEVETAEPNWPKRYALTDAGVYLYTGEGFVRQASIPEGRVVEGLSQAIGKVVREVRGNDVMAAILLDSEDMIVFENESVPIANEMVLLPFVTFWTAAEAVSRKSEYEELDLWE